MAEDAAGDEADGAVEVIRLSRRDSEIFVEALLNPLPPNDHLIETVRRYREAIAQVRHVSVDNPSELGAASYFAEGAARADIEKAKDILSRAGKGGSPVAGDEIPQNED